MQIDITWNEIAERLICTIIGGLLIGINRGEHGRAAGLRTTMLVCLAASFSMIQVNLLLNVIGKTSNSFVVLDLMRLPLGILSGMGFIGAGAILRRDNMVLGITTAATLWFVTVMGLCFGGGQIMLGFVGLALGLATLTGLKWVENRWTQERRATVRILIGENGATEEKIAKALSSGNYRVAFSSFIYGENGTIRQLICEIRWQGQAHDTRPPDFPKEFFRQIPSSKMDVWVLGNQ